MPVRRGKNTKHRDTAVEERGKFGSGPRSVSSGVPADKLEIRMDRGSNRSTVLDFAPIVQGLPPKPGSLTVSRPQMAGAFHDIFKLIGARDEPSSTLERFKDLKRFIAYLDVLAATGTLVIETSQIDSDILLGYRAYLHADDRHSLGVRRRSWSYLSSTLAFARDVRPEDFRALPERFPRWKGGSAVPVLMVSKEVLYDADLVRILNAAEEDQEARHERRLAILDTLKRADALREKVPDPKGNRKIHPMNHWKVLENAVYVILREPGIASPVDHRIAFGLSYHGHPKWEEILGSYVPFAEEGLLEDFLQIAIRLGLNPSSVATLTRDCLQPFRLPQYLVLEYDKPRAGPARGKMVIVPRNGVVARTIRSLLDRTEPLVKYAQKDAANLLFLYRRNFGPATRRGPVAGLFRMSVFRKSMLQAFTARHADCCGVPIFTLAELRASIATNLYLETRDVLRVKRLLGHKSVSATFTYLRGRVLALDRDREMVGAIRDHEALLYSGADKRGRTRALPILSNIIEGDATSVERSLADMVRSGQISEDDKDTILRRGLYTGFARCRRPYESPWKEVPKGTLCTETTRCLECEHAFILEEDLWKVLLDRERLLEERGHFTAEGWTVLFGDRYLMLNQIILRFSAEARMRAATRLRTETSLELSEGANA